MTWNGKGTLPGHNASLKGIMAGIQAESWSQALKQRCRFLDYSQAHIPPSFPYTPDYLPRDGIAHSGLGLPTVINNQERPYNMLTVYSDGGSPS